MCVLQQETDFSGICFELNKQNCLWASRPEDVNVKPSFKAQFIIFTLYISLAPELDSSAIQTNN